MTAAFVGNVTAQELEAFREGNFSELPDSYAGLAEEPQVEAKVLALTPATWSSLAEFASEVLAAQQQPQASGQKSRLPPLPILLCMVLPTVRLLGYLRRKYQAWRAKKATQAQSKDTTKAAGKKDAAKEKKKQAESKKGQ
mmetsp:Transcript_21706/g.32713  ORF Transcript_21706/g.32713 Transcript_21706/m.32713 type:complete len:140 (+) Transcript_21706:7-426(+)